VLDRLFQIVHLQTEVLVTDRVGRLLHFIFAVGEQFDKLSLGKLQKQQFWSLTFLLCMENFSCAEDILIPSDTPL
jgi:hypothetical protein